MKNPVGNVDQKVWELTEIKSQQEKTFKKFETQKNESIGRKS